MIAVSKGNVINLDGEYRLEVTSNPVVIKNELRFSVRTLPVTKCPECDSINTAQWADDDERHPSWLCQDCGIEWTDAE